MPKRNAKGKKTIANNFFQDFIGFVSLLLLGVSIFNLKIILDKQKVLGATTQAAESETVSPSASEAKIFWEKIISEHPTYRDGYIELANIYQEEGAGENANQYLKKALEVDPN